MGKTIKLEIFAVMLCVLAFAVNAWTDGWFYNYDTSRMDYYRDYNSTDFGNVTGVGMDIHADDLALQVGNSSAHSTSHTLVVNTTSERVSIAGDIYLRNNDKLVLDSDDSGNSYIWNTGILTQMTVDGTALFQIQKGSSSQYIFELIAGANQWGINQRGGTGTNNAIEYSYDTGDRYLKFAHDDENASFRWDIDSTEMMRLSNTELEVSNGTGAVFKVNTTSGKVEIWHPGEGTNDYVSLYHNGVLGGLNVQSGDLYFDAAGAVMYVMNAAAFRPSSGGGRDLGHTSYEWKNFYLYEGPTTGLWLGNSQDTHLWFNGTSNVTKLDASTSGSVDVVTPQLKIWDEAEATNDFISLYHAGNNAYINTHSGTLYLGLYGGGVMGFRNNLAVPSIPNVYSLGSTTLEFEDLFIGEDAGTGIYFGLDQDWQLFYNETSADELQLTGSNKFNIDDDTLVVDAANNRVGIGTSSPQKIFHLNAGNVDNVMRLESTDVIVGFQMLDDGGEMRMYYSSGNNMTHFSHDGNINNAPIVIDYTNKRVGIGTTTPITALDIMGNLTINATAGQSGINMYDENHAVRCVKTWSDGAVNSTSGAC